MSRECVEKYAIINLEMESSNLKLAVDNENFDNVLDFFYIKNSEISDEGLKKLKNHFNTNFNTQVHPWDFEKNLDGKLKDGDRIHYLYLYYLIWTLSYHTGQFKIIYHEIFDGNVYKSLKRDEELNSICLQGMKHKVLGFKEIKGSR